MKKIFEFPVLYAGWELDCMGWIVEDNKGKRSILLTNHGMEYTAEPEDLVTKINEYQSAINKTLEALALL